MATLDQHIGSKFVKLLYVGDSGVGKTGSLAPLVTELGIKLHILDYDNGVQILKSFVPSDKWNLIDVETRRDKYKASKRGAYTVPVISGIPAAFTDGLGLLEKWTDGTDPSKWGKDRVLILDSGSGLGRAAYEWAKYMAPTVKDPRQWFYTAQQGVEDVISLLTSEAFETNVIVISHIRYQEGDNNSRKGYPNTVGAALGPIIPRYFNTLIQAEVSGSGKNARRVIRTLPTGVVDLKTPEPFKLNEDLPLGSGLATIFNTLRG